MEDLNFIVLIQKKFSYLESIPGVLLPHPSSTALPFRVDGCVASETWPIHSTTTPPPTPPPTIEFYNEFSQPVKITPSMSSLEALLSKLPSVVPTQSFPSSGYYDSLPPQFLQLQRPPPLEFMETRKLAKEEIDDYGHEQNSTSTSISYYDQNQHQFFN